MQGPGGEKRGVLPVSKSEFGVGWCEKRMQVREER